MGISPLLEQSSRIALAAFLHDLGKFAERAKVPVDQQTLDDNKQLYCPHSKAFTDAKGHFTHVHAAYTGLAMDLIEGYLPDLTGEDFAPFGSWKTKNVDDSFINAAAMHHKPGSFLQWMVATADRVASGFDREEFEQYNQAEEGTETGKNHYTARQLTLFEQINKPNLDKHQFAYRYPLKPLSPGSIFPVKAEGYENNDKQKAQDEYLQLWQGFLQALEKMPKSHRQNWALWLDHFETVWGVYTQAIPSATAFNVRPDVSLYDHSRITAALATALWRYHHETNDMGETARKKLSDQAESWDEPKFLLIQGDFFGIQDFIFANGGETNKRAAKLLRGRSFYVSLLSECAALKVLDSLDLPSTSQVINAAGKFMIVAANTDETKAKLQQVQQELDGWFLNHSYGQAGVGLAWTEAACNDFKRGKAGDVGPSPYRQLIDKLFAQMEIKKSQRFDLCSSQRIVFNGFLDEFEHGECKIDGRSPAKVQKDGEWISELANDQVDIGSWLVNPNKQRILITRKPLREDKKLNNLGLAIFGFSVSFTDDENEKGEFGAEAKSGNLLRVWDFSLPQTADSALWNGYARRNINAYVPRATEADKLEEQWNKYVGIDEKLEIGAPKTLNHLASADRQPDRNNADKWIGISALSTLKGDVDNLGAILQTGLADISFSKYSALSRQLNNFFTVYLPWLCQNEYPDSYTVFAGGDDFFLIGPWLSQIKLAGKMRQAFQDYVAQNKQVHFSAGISTTKPGLPINQIGDLAEEGLDRAKAHNPENLKIAPKNAVCCFNQCVSWDEFQQLLHPRLQGLQRLVETNDLSTGYVYGLLNLINMAEKVGERPENALWHSYFAYRTARMLDRLKLGDDKQKAREERNRRQQALAQEIAESGIKHYQGKYRITLFCHLYQQRD